MKKPRKKSVASPAPIDPLPLFDPDLLKGGPLDCDAEFERALARGNSAQRAAQAVINRVNAHRQ